ncbi:MAG: TonB-dependent receptor [Amphiplicatus sp.]
MANGIRINGARRRKTRLKLTTVLTGAAAIAAAGAPPAAAQEGRSEDVVVVTGSRLQRSDLSAPSPTTVVGAEQIQNAGDATIESILYEFPQLAAGNTSSVNAAGGSGVLTANLRALGPTRTLVLVNGRRFVAANGDGSVDLATVPSALVERVEIITGGASAVYGSDAIAGAVNFILKENFTGVEASYQYGQTTKGDGAHHKADLTLGADFDGGRGNAVVHASYTQRDPVFMADREFSEISLGEVDGALVPFGSSNIPGTRIALSSGQLASLNGVDLTPSGSCTTLSGVRFDEGGVVVPFCQPEDAYNFATLNYLLRPMEREQIGGLASYEITPDVEAYSEVHYVNTRNAYQQAEESFALRTPGHPSGGLVVPDYATNPVLPDPVRQFFIDNPQLFDPDGDGDAIVIGTGRRGVETGPRHYDYERSAFSMTSGLRGSFALAERDWSWDVFGQFQRSRTDEAIDGQYSLTRLGLGLDVVDDGSGNAVCRVQILGCVPVNPFGIGSITPEAGAFIATTRTAKEVFERYIFGGSVSGELFDLPAGAVAAAAGFEHRHDEYDFTPGATDLAGEYGPTSRGITAGEYSVTEFFGEIRIPILADRPFFDILAVEGAVRHSDYSNFGGALTWKASGEWAPVDWLRFRSAYNRALRAPSLNELFSPTARGFTAGDDPCDVDFSPTQAQKDLCVAQGVPASDIDAFQQINVGFDAEGGGNPNLTEERSKTFTVGAVIRAPFLDGLNFAVDYFNIEVNDAIDTIGAQQTLDTCFALLDNSSAPCQAIVRLSNGQIDFVSTALSNIGSRKVRGVDVQVDYGADLPQSLSLFGDAPAVQFTAVAGWMFENTSQVVGAPARDCAGFFGGGCTGQTVFGTPDFKATMSVSYNSGPLSVRLQNRLIGKMELFPGVNSFLTEAGLRKYVDLSATYQATENLQVFAGLDNVFDEQPPLLGFSFGGDANTDVSIYDVVGRRFFVGARARF